MARVIQAEHLWGGAWEEGSTPLPLCVCRLTKKMTGAGTWVSGCFLQALALHTTAGCAMLLFHATLTLRSRL